MSDPIVHIVQDPPTAAGALEQRREANSLAILERQSDLATLTDAEFERRLVQMQTGYARLQRIMDTLMVPGVHYGTKDVKGKDVFKGANLTLAGAQVLRKAFRLEPVRHGDPLITTSAEYVQVVATVGVVDSLGRTQGVRSGICNSQEPRFFERPRSRGREDQAAGALDDQEEIGAAPDPTQFRAEKRAKPLYGDARETLHQCIAMAEKRAAGLATADATNWSGFQQEKARKAIQAKLAGGAQPWSEDEKQQIYTAAKRAKCTTVETLRKVITDTLGYEPPHAGDDVTKVLAALALWTPQAAAKLAGGQPAVKDAGDGYGQPAAPKPAPTPAQPVPPVEPGDAAEDDLMLDQQLAREQP